MTADLRKLWLDLKGSYWFIPTLLTIAALGLSLLTVHLDRTGGSQWLSYFPWYEPSRPDGARAQLTVIAGAMIAIASTVFAITIAAVAYASGNYGPRLLTNFMNDRGNQISLGIFISTFVYHLMILRVVRDAGEGATGPAVAADFVPQISMLVSTVSVIVAVGVLVYFLHHIPASIRINTVLGGIGRRLVRDIERRFPEAGGAVEPEAAVKGAIVAADEIGYIEIIDFARLDEIAGEAGVRIALKVRTGDFIHPHLPIAEFDGAASDEALACRIRDCFSLGEARTATQDLEFLIDELVEIALRALSPGINDPYTAVTSLHWMGAALAKLADRNLTQGPEQERYDVDRVRPVADDFRHFVNRSFGSLRPSAAGSPMAGSIFIDALSGVALGAASEERRTILLEEARLLVDQAEHALAGPSLEALRARLDSFETALAALPSSRGGDMIPARP